MKFIAFKVPDGMHEDIMNLIEITPKYDTVSKFLRKMLKTMINNAKEKHLI
ncbi:hypothetical protein LCGC14_0531570 [marine sediment metagenome]|uniref:Ribbon-helix-helix protein CopG domain-containing protein n=1 Tax=marine sediment metagenome TaxID=412755 RepID=A0A0F9UGZ6_9ZZZZ